MIFPTVGNICRARKFLFWCLILWLLVETHFPIWAQSQQKICEITLTESIRVELNADNSGVKIGALYPGEVVEYVGQTPDGVYWILRYAGGYALYATSEPDLRPEGCEVARWGAPSPDYRPLAEVMTAIGVDAWHEAGYYGQGVRVGVIDTRFDGLDELLATAALDATQITLLQPLENLTQVSPEATGTAPYHGTNVLEVLTAIAPQAEYVIAQAASAEQFQAAVDGLIAADVHIIVHAGNVITSDPGPYHDAVRRATAANILWVNSAGNIGAGYYPGRFSGGGGLLPLHQFEDPNRSGLQQGLMVPVNREGPVSVTVLWEDDRTAQVVNDFDLVVSGNCRLDATGTFQPLSSDNNQATSEAEPRERVVLTSGELAQIGDYLAVPSVGVQQACPGSAQPDGIADNEIYISLLDSGRSATVDTRFDVYVEGALPAAYDPDIARSLDPVVLPPGDIPESLTVGAYDPRTNQMAWYSGRYNSLQYYAVNGEVDYSDDEIVKPDIVTYGELLLPSGRQFFGTSAATPVVGGVVTVLGSRVSSDGIFDAEGIRERLSTYHVACLDGDGAVTQVLRYLTLQSPGDPGNLNSVTCGQFAWMGDLSSVIMGEQYMSPVIAGLEIERDVQAKAAESRRLSSLALNELETGDLDLALLLATEAAKLEDTYEARNSLLTALLETHIGQSATHTAGFNLSAFLYDESVLGFTPDSAHMLTVTPESKLAVWDLTDGIPKLQDVYDTGSEIKTSVVSSTVNLVAIGDIDGDIIVYDLDSGLPAGSIQLALEDGEAIVELGLSSSNVLTIVTSSHITTWNLESYSPLGQPVMNTLEDSVQFDRNGQAFLITKGDHTFTVMCLETREVLVQADIPANGVWPVLSPSGQSVAVPTTDGHVYLWRFGAAGHSIFSLDHASLNLSDYSYLFLYEDGIRSDSANVVFSPDSSIIGLTFSSIPDRVGVFAVWDIDTGQLLASPIEVVGGGSFSFSSDGKLLFVGDCWETGRMGACISGRLSAWSTSEQGILPFPSGSLVEYHGNPTQPVQSAPFIIASSPNGQFFVSVYDNQAILWSFSESNYSLSTKQADLPAPLDYQMPRTISPNKVNIAWASPHGKEASVYLWSLEENTLKKIVMGGLLHGISHVEFSPDSETLAIGDRLCNVYLFRIAGAEPVAYLESGFVNEADNCELSFSSNGQYLAESISGTTLLWDRHSLSKKDLFFTGTRPHFGSSHDTLITFEGTRLMIWDTITGQLQHEIYLDFEEIYPSDARTFSPDGKSFAASTGGPWGDTIGFWNIETGKLIGEPLPPAPDMIYSLAFSPDGDLLASSGTFASLRLFHVPTQKMIGQDLDFPNALEVTFSQDGRELLVLSDTELFTIDIGLDLWIRRACRIVNRNFTQEEWQQYSPGEPYRETCDLDAVYVPAPSAFSGTDSPSGEIHHTVILQELSLAFDFPLDWEAPFRRDEIFLAATQTGEEGLEG
ncbi:S8 family serine peptidase [Aggregatilinea lenta]|uniref:S8 family serine peptidase n=1 Tax=Aggregatilinea lenta TaxID=913108 RepID=UPI000E5C0F0C|nr:S8 family serine peptidase [Aggregatilinea lenta]